MRFKLAAGESVSQRAVEHHCTTRHFLSPDRTLCGSWRLLPNLLDVRGEDIRYVAPLLFHEHFLLPNNGKFVVECIYEQSLFGRSSAYER